MPYKNIEDRRKYMKKYREEHKEKVRETQRNWERQNKSKLSSKQHRDKDLSPNQQFSRQNLSTSEKLSIVSTLSGAIPKARKNNKYSNRKGVTYKEIKTKSKIYGYWQVRKLINGISYYQKFDTEAEAIKYVEYLENKYYTPEQLAIRDKYNK